MWTMTEVLSMKEIEARYDAEWVLLEDPATDQKHQVLSGQVLAHSRNRQEVDRCLLAARPRHYAMLYTGRLPEDAAIVL